MSDMPSIEEISLASEQLGLATDASELHGALCGWLAGGGLDTAAWPAKVLADDVLQTPAADSPLDRLRQISAQQLEDRGFAFELLLPDASESLSDRAQALFAWCRGFLGGFGLAAGSAPALSEEGNEALQDLARLAQADPDSGDGDGEEEEDALAEIEEFVRVATLLLHGDCVMAPRHRQSLN
ncbi:UPF0149 family protein [Pseudoxanthomonas dokdonensis]|uniref:Uncharacterized protein n=1 Tax=Pseudoxanthomonas dokdonensis TaxID=344882 RepID=A0A0R0CVZ9_9GAMM|nr:UPF0149 family protein [Pseudoxanthomonas dokdonensis]KRG70190.1 hypothetical protein ABB29_07215 [Pseudoxanthomonas dokdonensis]